MAYEVQCVFYVRNGNGNYMKQITGEYQPIEDGHLLRALGEAATSAINHANDPHAPKYKERKRGPKPPNHD